MHFFYFSSNEFISDLCGNGREAEIAINTRNCCKTGQFNRLMIDNFIVIVSIANWIIISKCKPIFCCCYRFSQIHIWNRSHLLTWHCQSGTYSILNAFKYLINSAKNLCCVIEWRWRDDARCEMHFWWLFKIMNKKSSSIKFQMYTFNMSRFQISSDSEQN